MSTEKTVRRSTAGFPFVWVLGVVFVTLKLVGEISWSWWLVLLPFYGGYALLIGIALVCVLLAAGAASVDKATGPRRYR